MSSVVAGSEEGSGNCGVGMEVSGLLRDSTCLSNEVEVVGLAVSGGRAVQLPGGLPGERVDKPER